MGSRRSKHLDILKNTKLMTTTLCCFLPYADPEPMQALLRDLQTDRQPSSIFLLTGTSGLPEAPAGCTLLPGASFVSTDGLKQLAQASGDAEYLLARNALNDLRNQRIASGGYTDAADAALANLLRAKVPFHLFGHTR